VIITGERIGPKTGVDCGNIYHLSLRRVQKEDLGLFCLFFRLPGEKGDYFSTSENMTQGQKQIK
jgi:hypothetical protein